MVVLWLPIYLKVLHKWFRGLVFICLFYKLDAAFLVVCNDFLLGDAPFIQKTTWSTLP